MAASRRSAASIEVVGADANNLQSVDVTFPLKRISVVTGVSGSGKSSLLADTLAAEGTRRNRIFLGVPQEDLERDDVQAFVGALPPTVLVGQRDFRPSVRTTVGTATGFLGVLRRLFVHAAVPYSERVKGAVPEPSPDSYAGWIAKHYRGSAEVWAAPVRQQRTDGTAAVRRLASAGIEHIVIYSETDPPGLREGGRTIAVSQFKPLNPKVAHTIEASIGRIEVEGVAQIGQLQTLLVKAFSAANGFVVVTLPDAQDDDLTGPFGPRLDTTNHWVHPVVPEVFVPPSAHLLSFNAPEHEKSGACRECAGTGVGHRLKEESLISHPERSMNRGAFAIWTDKNYKYVNVQHDTIEGLRGMRGFSPDVPWSRLPQSARALILEGSAGEPVFDRGRAGRKYGAARPFLGFRRVILNKSFARTKAADQLSAYVETGPCGTCNGTRWSRQASALRVGGYGVSDILAKTFRELETLTSSQSALERSVPADARPLVERLHRHARSIVSVGLGYLSPARGMLEVSDGESRRIRLALVLDAGERGLCLLLDEPARGLHEFDLVRLADALQRLRGEHTVILNEHRERLWAAADWFVEVGPGAGAEGGHITYADCSIPSRGDDEPPLRSPLPPVSRKTRVVIRGASVHNIADVDCEIPIGRLTCICGVSGSGKSSFVRGVLAPALLESRSGAALGLSLRGRWRSVSGAGAIDEVVTLDQAMPPSNRRSLVATFTGVFDQIRKVFGGSPAAKKDGLSASDFGVNGGQGRCPRCLGIGDVGDGGVWSPCPSCGGARFGHAASSVRVAGVNVQELLDRPLDRLTDVAEVFRIPQNLIAVACDLGLGYVALGRRLDTLSGGEVQRLRLAMHLSLGSSKSMFFMLDEPAVGLHPRDVRRVATALERAVDGGRNSMVIIEHDLSLIQAADWVIEFGPGSGPDGGRIVFEGPPDRLVKARTPTGLALAGKLPAAARSRQKPARVTSKPTVTESALRTEDLLRSLIGADETPAHSTNDGTAEPVVIVSERFWADRNGWEVAGLDEEVPKLLLDIQGTVDSEGVFSQLLATWREVADGWLAIHPFVTDMQVWATELPVSVVQSVSSHLSREGLRLVTMKGDRAGKDFDPRRVRVTGDRFIPSGDSDDARLRVIRDAFAIGAKYVELRDRNGRLRAIATSRIVDLERGVIAPMVPVPAQFSRFTQQGRCLMCQGSRFVTTLDDSLVIANKESTPDRDDFLTAEASAVMKGVRRLELNPFLRRLAREGLWDLKTPFHALATNKRNLVIFGYWSRPGHGSFLKTPAADRSEVSSWLRWDGLYRHVLEQADRSRDRDWIRHLRESARDRTCPRCGGSGLHPVCGPAPGGRVIICSVDKGSERETEWSPRFRA